MLSAILMLEGGYANLARQGAFFLLFLLVAAILCYGVWYLIGLFPPALHKPLYAVAVVLGIIFILLFLAGGLGGGLSFR